MAQVQVSSERTVAIGRILGRISMQEQTVCRQWQQYFVSPVPCGIAGWLSLIAYTVWPGSNLIVRFEPVTGSLVLYAV